MPKSKEIPKLNTIRYPGKGFSHARELILKRIKAAGKGLTQKENMSLTIQLAVAEMGTGNMKEAQRLIDICESYVLSYGLPEEKGALYFLKAMHLSSQSKLDEGMQLALRALHTFQQIDMPLFTMRSLVLCGRFCSRLNMTSEGIEYMNRGLEIARAIKDKHNTLLAMFNLNDIKSNILSPEQVLRNATELAVYLEETQPDNENIGHANVYEAVSLAAINVGDIDKAVLYADKAVAVRAKLKGDLTLAGDHYNLLARICSAQADEKGMLHYTDKGLEYGEINQQVLCLMRSHTIRFDHYIRLGQIAKAKKHLDAAYATGSAYKNSQGELMLAEMSLAYSQAKGDIKAELEYTRKIYEYKTNTQQLIIEHRIKHLNAVHELELSEKKNEIMKKELNLKSQELNLANHYLQQRNELLNDLKGSINALKKENAQREAIFNTLFKKIDMAFNKEENERHIFKEKFDQAHVEFIRKLSNKYKKLTPSECRICALLHSGFATKEIATLLSTTERNIETHRLHIRQKLGLKRTDNLNLVLAAVEA